MVCVCVVWMQLRQNLDQGMLCLERVGSWMEVTRDDMSGEVHIQLLSCEDTGEVGSYGSTTSVF